MPALQHPRQAAPLDAWLSDPVGRGLLLEAQAAWCEQADAPAGGQAWLRLLPEASWPVAEPAARFSEAFTLVPCIDGWHGAWRADHGRLPLAGGAVSRLDLRFVLESVPEPEALLQECARVLRPEGRLLVFGLNPFGAARLRWARHGVRARSRAAVAATLRDAGLDVLTQRTLGPLWGPKGEEAPAGRASRVNMGRVAWAILATRRLAGLTPVRRGSRGWRASPGVPAS
jgi:SAM-dependent methyltransferase